MSWQVPISTNTQVTLTGDDDVFVAQNVLLAGDTGIFSASGSHWARVYGDIVSPQGPTVYLIGNTDNTNSTTVDLYKGSNLEGLGGDTVELRYGSNTVNNFGTIHANGLGINFSGSDKTQTETIDNHGTIIAHALEAGADQVIAISRDSAATIKLTNEGTIQGDQFSYGLVTGSGQGVDIIVNKGTMIGAIDLQGGKDSYDGRLGVVKGSISGGDGADTLLAGAGNNVIDGGSGADKISGGAGADKLTGGADADMFLFNSVSDSTVAAKGRDTIMDFKKAEHDHISLKAIDADSQTVGDQAFHFIGTSDFHGHAGELRFETSGGNAFVSGDINGDGKADFSIELLGVTSLDKHDFAL